MNTEFFKRIEAIACNLFGSVNVQREVFDSEVGAEIRVLLKASFEKSDSFTIAFYESVTLFLDRFTLEDFDYGPVSEERLIQYLEALNKSNLKVVPVKRFGIRVGERLQIEQSE